MDNTNSGKTTLILKGSQSKALLAGKSNTVRAQRGEHYKVVKKNAAGEEQMQDEVIAKKMGDHLLLSYADGTQLTLENYYVQCKAGDCDLTLPSSDPAGYKLSADGTTGAALADGSTLSYAYGTPSSLMAMAQGDAALSSNLAGLQGSQATYTPPASAHAAPSSFGGSGLLAALGGLGLAAAAGGGGGGSSNPTSIPNSLPTPSPSSEQGPTTSAPNIVLKGQITAGPAIDGNGLQVEVFQADGKTSLGITKLNADGTFSLGVAGYSGVVIIKVKDTNPAVADYIDEATGQAKNLDTLLMAVAIASNGTVTANVNPVTTIAALKAGLSIDGTFTDNNATQLSAAQVSAANAGVASALGLDDILGTAPVTTVTASATANSSFDSANGISTAETYGAVLAALSGVDKTHNDQAIALLAAGIDISGGHGTMNSSTQSLLVEGASTAAENPNSAGRDVLAKVVAAAAGISATPPGTESGLSDALVLIQEAADANNAASRLSTSTFAKAGVTGVSDANLGAIESALDSKDVTSAQVSSTAKIQDLVNAYAAILVGADGDASNNNAYASAAQYRLVGVTVGGTASASLLNDVVDGKQQADLATVAQLQSLADAANAVIAGAGGGTAPTLQELTRLGIHDVNASNLKAVQAAIAAPNDSGAAVDTLAELQALVTAVPPAAPVMALVTDTGSSPTDGITTDGTIKISNLEDGATWQYSTDGTTWFDGSGTSFTLQGDGERTVHVRQTDGGGKQSEEASLTFTIDTTPPAMALVDLFNDTGPNNLDHATRDATICFSDVASGVTRKYSVDNGALSDSYARPTSDGEHTVVVTDTDAAGNSSSSSLTFMLDTVAPVITSLDTATIADRTGYDHLAYQALTNDPSGSIENVSFWSLDQSQQGGDWQYFLMYDSLPGMVIMSFVADYATKPSYTFTVIATDQAGNHTSKEVTLYVAPPPPTLALNRDTGLSDSDLLTNDASLSVSAAAQGVTRSYSVDNSNASAAYTIPTSEGEHTVTVTDTYAGGMSSTSSLTFTLDNTPPDAPTVNNVGTNNTINASEWESFTTISGTCEEGASVHFLNSDTYIPVNGTNWTYTLTQADRDLFFNHQGQNDFPEGYDGIPYFFYQIDAAGNEASGSENGLGCIVIKVDTKSPDSSALSDIRFNDDVGNITGLIASNSTSDDTTPTLSGKATADVARVNIYDGDTRLGVADVTDGVWTFTPSSGLTEGSHTLSVKAVDAVGNEASAASASLTFTIDTTPPDAPTVNNVGTNNTINASEWESFKSISGTCEEGATVTINGADNSNIIVNGTTWTYTLPQDDLNFLLDYQDSPPIIHGSEGNCVGYSLLVTQTDAAGNTSDTKTFVFNVDTNATDAVTAQLASNTYANYVL